MIHTNNLGVIQAKQFFANCKHCINFLMLLFGVLGTVYILYWVGIMCQSNTLNYTESLFKPIANIFFPESQSLDMYKNTGLALYALVIPTFFGYFILNKLEDVVVLIHHNNIKTKNKKEKQAEFLDSLKEFDIINSYSICLSIDYESKDGSIIKNKNVLNDAIYEKIKSTINKRNFNVNTSICNALIINSKNFNNYDKLYEDVLSVLASIKPKVESKYNIKLIPSITTDAYTKDVSIEKIKSVHFGIQQFNLKNRACSTALFSKKYKHLQKNKYLGIPIGEYITSDNYSTTYELNVVHKNLSQTLASL